MKDLPYFRWFPADAETDETYRMMTDAERGFYHHCLNISWINDGLPADPKARARALDRNRNQADSLWKGPVASRFVPHPYRGGYLADTRLLLERVHAESKSAKASESIKARYERTVRASDSVSVSSLEVNLATETKTVSAREELVIDAYVETAVAPDDFGRFMEACDLAEMRGSEPDLKRARGLWGRLSFADKLAAVQGIKDRVAVGELPDAQWGKLPNTYLKDKVWQRPIRMKMGYEDKKGNGPVVIAGMLKNLRRGNE